MLLTMWTGMYLAAKNLLPWSLWISATTGIALICGSAATLNHIIDRKTDALMDRTKNRPLAAQKIPLHSAWVFAMTQGILGLIILCLYVNTLTALLTFLSASGYAGIYSLYLKKATPQNIVIGGLAGAMPPLLGWTAVTGHLDPQAWLLVLIIFTWTPAHFWALCLHRYEEYRQTTIPMLPMTHGIFFTKINIVLYSLLTIAVSMLPYVIGMSDWLYLGGALLLNVGLLVYALKLQFSPNENQIALKTFHYSLLYLTGLFFIMILDHHLTIT